MKVASFSSAWLRTLITPSVVAMGLLAAQGAAAQRLTGNVVRELVDEEERISGNATIGVVLGDVAEEIGHDRLWALLSPPEPAANPPEPISKLKLRISSIDGRYGAEVDFDSVPAVDAPTWFELDLGLKRFDFLEEEYGDQRQIAVLLSDAEDEHFYPVRWGNEAGGERPKRPEAGDPVRVYLNTEHATAYFMASGQPRYCVDASLNSSITSAFKFDTLCTMTLDDVKTLQGGGGDVVVFRGAGVRVLDPIRFNVRVP